MNGGFSPLEGFMNQKDYDSFVKSFFREDSEADDLAESLTPCVSAMALSSPFQSPWMLQKQNLTNSAWLLAFVSCSATPEMTQLWPS